MKLVFKIICVSIIGILLGILVLAGNPANMGICAVCFTRDIAGALGLHNFQTAQYIRPEIIGIILGSAVLAFLRGQFLGLSGSISIYKFIFGFCMSVGALVFMGCPFRLLQRLGGGDGTAISGAIGFITGVGIGLIFEKYGYALPELLPSGKHIAILGVTLAIILFLLLTLMPAGVLQSKTGIGSIHAPIYISLLIAVVTGGLLQITGFCTVSMIRGIFLSRKRIFLLMGIFIILAYTATLFFTDKLNIGFSKQPFSHKDYLWSFLGMILVGLAGVLAKGCPLRQIVMTGEGNAEALITFLGMIVGAAIAHNFGAAATMNGVTLSGKYIVIAGIGFCIIFGIFQIIYIKNIKYEEIVKRY